MALASIKDHKATTENTKFKHEHGCTAQSPSHVPAAENQALPRAVQTSKHASSTLRPYTFLFLSPSLFPLVPLFGCYPTRLLHACTTYMTCGPLVVCMSESSTSREIPCAWGRVPAAFRRIRGAAYGRRLWEIVLLFFLCIFPRFLSNMESLSISP